VIVLTYRVVVSLILIRSVNIIEQEEIAGKLYIRNTTLIYSAREIKRITWLLKAKPRK
jgi:hypothetical protein